jgi:hypothetical protein
MAKPRPAGGVADLQHDPENCSRKGLRRRLAGALLEAW